MKYKLMILFISSAILLIYYYKSHLNKSNNLLECTRNVKIAIIDSGIDTKVLKSNVIERYKNTYPLDSLGHGTAIASIIQDKNPNTDIYDINILNESGATTNKEIIQALEYAMEKEVDIINMSFGTSKIDNQLRKKLMKYFQKIS